MPDGHYVGPPSRETIAWILRNTHTDSNGKRFYTKANGSQSRLETPAQFADLNCRLDKHRWPMQIPAS